jgi:hypothetical protein
MPAHSGREYRLRRHNPDTRLFACTIDVAIERLSPFIWENSSLIKGGIFHWIIPPYPLENTSISTGKFLRIY